jgi:hypothetical protein
VEDPTHNNEPYEYKRDQGDARESSPISISTIAPESPSSALGVLKPPPSITEAASDVAPSSIRSFGKRDSPNLKAVEEAATQEIPYLPQDRSAIGGQFDDGQAGEPPDLEEIQSQTLENQLWDAQIEWPKGQNRYFIPADEQLRLIKTESIITELRRCMISLTREQLLKSADQIFDGAPRLFAILVYMSKSDCILSFLDEGLSDDDLPFIRAELKGNGLGTGSGSSAWIVGGEMPSHHLIAINGGCWLQSSSIRTGRGAKKKSDTGTWKIIVFCHWLMTKNSRPQTVVLVLSGESWYTLLTNSYIKARIQR